MCGEGYRASRLVVRNGRINERNTGHSKLDGGAKHRRTKSQKQQEQARQEAWEKIEASPILQKAQAAYEVIDALLTVGYLYAHPDNDVWTQHIEHWLENGIVEESLKVSPHCPEGKEVFLLIDKPSLEIAKELLLQYYPEIGAVA